jgi:biopolymer transport protein ExbD
MGYGNQKQSATGSLIALVLLLGFLFLGALLVVGVGGYLFMYQARAKQMAHAERARAEIAQLRAREAQALLEQAQAAATAQSSFLKAHDRANAKLNEIETMVDDWSLGQAEVTIHMDENGELKLGDEAVDLDTLKTRLAAASEYGSTKVVAAIQVDKQCRFEHVSNVLSICKELKISDISVNATK